MGLINQVGQDFISELGRQLSSSTDDPRETSFLFQRLSVAVQRFNAISLTYSFDLTQFDATAAAYIPKHIIESTLFKQMLNFSALWNSYSENNF